MLGGRAAMRFSPLKATTTCVKFGGTPALLCKDKVTSDGDHQRRNSETQEANKENKSTSEEVDNVSNNQENVSTARRTLKEVTDERSRFRLDMLTSKSQEIALMLKIEEHHVEDVVKDSSANILDVIWCPSYVRPALKGFARGGDEISHHRCKLCQQICFHLLNDGEKYRPCLRCAEKHFKALTILLMEMCHEQLLIGLPLLSSLVLLNKVAKVKPWILVTNGVVLAVSYLLLTCSNYYVQQLLKIASNISNYIVTSCPSYGWKLSPFVLPLLQTLATSNNSTTNRMAIQSLSGKLLTQIEKTLQAGNPADNFRENTDEPFLLPGNWLRKMLVYEKVLQFVESSNESTLLKWLQSVESSISDAAVNEDLNCVSLLLSTFLMNCSETAAFHVLNAISSVCKVDPTQALYFLPLLLSRIERSRSSDLKLHILYAIPKLATHKVCVTPVLRTLLVINNHADLKAITLRLMFKLWLLQPRVYSHLQKLIQEKTLSLNPQTKDELQLARAVTIRDICRERPTQHGEDLVGHISEIINENAYSNCKTHVVLVCLALEALEALASAEVVDLGSAWTALKFKLEHNPHLLIVRVLSDLFAVVPSLAVDSEEYEKFKEDVLTYLWGNTLHENTMVCSAALNSLAKFDPSDFQIRYLPTKISKNITEHLKSLPKVQRMIEEGDENGEEIDLSSFPIPAYFYVELLQMISVPSHEACEKFLKNLVQQEISQLPRGLAHKFTKPVETPETKAMAAIPVILKKQYEKCKQPLLTPSLAASLLFCYDLRVENREGKAIRSQMVNNAKSFRQMMKSLVQQVPLQSSQWHRNVDTCHAWTGFMTRVFRTSIEGRQAELAIQKSHGRIDEEELNFQLKDSWLWVRDLLADQLKMSSKGTHIMQGNSVLALAGLAKAVSSYHSSIEHDSTTTDKYEQTHKPIKEWLAAIVDTLLVILDGNLKTTGSPMNWCQQVSSDTSSASSLLARACAALGMSQVAPALLTGEFERIQQVFQTLQVRIPGQAKAGNSSVIQTHSALGMGLLMKQLYQENISDFFGQEGYMLLARGLDALETAAFSSELDNTEGAVYGLGLSLTSLCKETAVAARMHAQTTYTKIVECHKRQGNEESSKLQAFSLALAYSTVSSFGAGLQDVESVLKTTLDMEKVVAKFSQEHVLASAFGLLVHGLKISGLSRMEELFSRWEKRWESIALNQSLSSNLRLAAVSGLSALFGSELPLTMIDSTVGSKSRIEDGVKILKQLLQSSSDVTLSGNVSLLLGRLWLASKSSLNSQSNVPDNLGYLGEDSVLNCLVDLLIKLGKTGTPPSSQSVEVINTTLRVLTEGPKNPLPPLNWMNVLVPLMKINFGSKTTELCLHFALNSSSPAATGAFLPSWLSPSVIMNLGDFKVQLFLSLGQLVRILSTKKSKEILEIATKLYFEKELDTTLAEAILAGLHTALTMTDLPESVVGCVRETVENIYQLLPNNLKAEHFELVSKLGACLQHFPIEDIEKLTKPKTENLTKVLALSKRLINQNQTLSWKVVKPSVDLALSSKVEIDVLASVVSAISCLKRENLHDIIVEWIMQLLTSLGIATNFSEATTAIFVVLTVLLIIKDNNSSVTATILALQHQDTLVAEGLSEHRHVFREWFSIVTNLFPAAFPRLLENPEWKIPVEKVIDKLLSLYESLHAEASCLILECLLELRRFDVYEKRSVWTQVASYL